MDNNIKTQIKQMLQDGKSEGDIANDFTSMLYEAMNELQEDNISTKTEISQVDAINNFLVENCPNLNFTLKEDDLKAIGQMINTVIPAFEQMIALILDKNMDTFTFPVEDLEKEMLTINENGELL
jgi:hypothetical protein